MRDSIVKRFLRYVAFDTMSDPHAKDKRPSTDGQLEILRHIEKELKEIGVDSLHFDNNGYLVAKVASNLPPTQRGTTIGFMAHVDVADDVMGNGVKATLINSYDGKDIVLANGELITVAENRELERYIGDEIIVTDGTTLLGADDKAGVAICVETAKYLVENPQFLHGEVEFIFTTDEEIGKGMDSFDLDTINSVCCYTLDGGSQGIIEAECFNAATVTIDFYGIAAHLGDARGKMVSSVAMATTFLSSLPRTESPEATDGRYGYYAAEEIHGTTAHTRLTIYVRDFESEGLNRRLDVLKSLSETTEKLFVGGKVKFTSEIVYRNMYEAIQKNPLVMDAIYKSGEKLGIALTEKIIRGGTDGSKLAEMGIPAPNLYTGAHNLHSTKEWLAVPTMLESAALVTQIISYWAGVDG